jgi:hypothetical protein
MFYQRTFDTVIVIRFSIYQVVSPKRKVGNSVKLKLAHSYGLSNVIHFI